MSRILKSIMGRKLGLDHGNVLLSQKGFVSGDNGKQIALPSPTRVALFDDFIGDRVSTSVWQFVEGTDSATSSAAILTGGIGGVLRLTTGDAGTGLAADTEQMTANQLMWQASNGGLSLQARLKLSQITECYVFVGFTDTVAASLEAPIMSAGSADTFTTNASDAVGFMFDTRMTTDNIWLTGVKADVDATHQNSGVAPVAAQYLTLRVDVDSSGNATFYINGVQRGTTLANAITAATDLTPVVTVSKTATASSMTLDLDYLHITMDRAADGGAV